MIEQSIIDDFNNDPILFMLNNNLKLLSKILVYANDKYHNGNSIISDESYDTLFDLINYIDSSNPILKKIGSNVKTHKTKLLYTMYSMDKIKPTDKLIIDRWSKTYKGPYIYSDKLDGISALIIKTNNKLSLFTRGNGTIGSDISHLLPYIKSIPAINNLPQDIAVRGELIISKETFNKYSNDFANARNMVSGIVNSKKIKSSIIADIDFVVYELINPWIHNQNEQFKMLTDYKFKVVHYQLDIDIDFANLSSILINRKTLSAYEIDGIIVSNNILPNRTTNKNPDYAFAFKDTSIAESADVVVLNVEWNISKDGYIKPKLNINPTNLSGVIISNVTAYNAKYVVDNVLGPGSIVKIIRSGDVIPKIISIIKHSTTDKPQLPTIKYKWNSTNIDIITETDNKTPTDEQHIKELTHFFKKLNIQNINSAIVIKMINAGIDSIEKILIISKEQLSQIDNFKEKMIEKIYSNIHNRIKDLTLLDLMIASNIFGHGLGEKKLTKIINTYPNIINEYIQQESKTTSNIIAKIIDIDGFDTKSAELFANNLDSFVKLLNNLNKNIYNQLLNKETKQLNKPINIINNKFIDKIFVFSGFRNKDWENIIISNGGKVNSTISSKTTYLIITDINSTSSKIQKAKDLNIQILSKDQFENDFIL